MSEFITNASDICVAAFVPSFLADYHLLAPSCLFAKAGILPLSSGQGAGSPPGAARRGDWQTLEDEENGRSDHFPQGTGSMSMFFRMSTGTKLKYPFNKSSLNRKKKKINEEKQTINAPKWQQIAETWQFPSYAKFLN